MYIMPCVHVCVVYLRAHVNPFNFWQMNSIHFSLYIYISVSLWVSLSLAFRLRETAGGYYVVKRTCGALLIRTQDARTLARWRAN